MSGARSMHEQTCLLDGIGDVGASEGKILESAGETSVMSRIIDKIAISER